MEASRTNMPAAAQLVTQVYKSHCHLHARDWDVRDGHANEAALDRLGHDGRTMNEVGRTSIDAVGSHLSDLAFVDLASERVEDVVDRDVDPVHVEWLDEGLISLAWPGGAHRTGSSLTKSRHGQPFRATAG